jgi:dTDP-4-dehydrorhamnose 3,5-epimerase
MTISDTILPGVFILECDVFPDDRGELVTVWVRAELERLGLDSHVALANLSTNRRRGTIRGLHFQTPPVEEIKIVRAVRGAVFDVVADLRPDSATYRRWIGVELDADAHRMVYVPRGVAHGYQTLTDDSAVFYFVSAPYSPPHQRGLRWNDPGLGIDWPLGAPTSISARDAAFPDCAF